MQATREVRGALPGLNGSQSIRDCVGPASLSPWVRRSYEWARGLNLSIDLRDEASHERFAICCRRHGNREGLVFLSLSIRRRHTRPSSWRPLGDLSPICRIREGPPALHLLSSS